MAVSAIFGGTFDPPHNGHVALARAAIRRFGLTRLEVAVIADPAHKDEETPAEARLELCRLAFADVDEAVVGLEEEEYTVDSLERRGLRDQLFLIGADGLAALPTWKEPERVLELARLGVAMRPGYPREQLDAVLAELARPERVELFELEPLPISSTEIRERVRRGEPIDQLVPPTVARRIAELGLYEA